MTEEQSKLLISLDVKIRHLIFLYKNITKERDELCVKLKSLEEDLQTTQGEVERLEKRCQNMMLLNKISVSEEESIITQNRLSKLEREIDKCIALLNE